VLKNHLVVEQIMHEFLLASGKKANDSFADKAQHCQNLKPPELDPPVWKVLTHANRLRNKIAHTLDDPNVSLVRTQPLGRGRIFTREQAENWGFGALAASLHGPQTLIQRLVGGNTRGHYPWGF